jgi:ribosomal protein S12 methylthiotransferase
MNRKIALVSLGCAKNLVNSEEMLFLLGEAGFELVSVSEEAPADAVVINTCGFIEAAKLEAINTILDFAELKQRGVIGRIIVTGCLAQRYREELREELPEIDVIAGTGSYHEIVRAVEAALAGERASFFSDASCSPLGGERAVSTGAATAYLKIAEGCDNRCAYCVIPALRGKYRSRDIDAVVREAEALAAAGIKEIIVVAQDITRYGLDLCGRRRLPELLERLCGISGVAWIRLHYIYPDEIDDELIELIAKNDKILKYLDIPIQHVDDEILRKMRRRGSGAFLGALIEKLRGKIPSLVLRTSVITGLPGEGEAEFEALAAFLRENKIERAGVFSYSPEEGTDAALMDYPEEEIAKNRANIIEGLQSDVIDEYNRSRIGLITDVLIEGYDGSSWYGRSYAESPDIDGLIFIAADDINVGEFVTVEISEIIGGDVLGVPC